MPARFGASIRRFDSTIRPAADRAGTLEFMSCETTQVLQMMLMIRMTQMMST
jgi:hypothetical protein